ncbi:MAG: thioredoxin domain-containing protein [Arcobacteraceae bacterium]
MRLSMLKLLTILSLLSSSLYANENLDEKILDYEEKKISTLLQRQNIELNDVSIALKKDLKQNGWHGYVFNLSFTVKGQRLTQKDTLFTDGNLITPELINARTKRSYKNELYPILGEKYFDKAHLIAGNADAEHTLVLFSDPLCPICVDEVPTIMKNVMDNPEKIALYYYHLPLEMHPTAKLLSKAAMIANEMNINDVDYKLYTTDFSQYFDAYNEKDDAVALMHFNRIFDTEITMEQINDPKLEERINYELGMSNDAFVNGTPTLFLDGQIDKTRMQYEKYLK